MQLTKIEIHNYRLLVNAYLNVDKDSTLIVGRNNSAKTSCMDFLSKILKGNNLSYDDYPLSQRKCAFILFAKFLKGKLTYDDFRNKLPKPSMRFYIDYSHEDDEDYLGSLSPFIIDVDESCTKAIILAEYNLKVPEEGIRELFTSCISFDEKGTTIISVDEVRDKVSSNFAKIFSLSIKAINPSSPVDTQNKNQQELQELFPLYTISAERNLDETGNASSSSLKAVISSYFSVDIDDLDAKIAEKVKELRNKIANANSEIQKETNTLLSKIINSSVGFGYPNAEELQLGVSTNVALSNQIQDNSELNYSKVGSSEKLPSNYNGLGYKNLIKIQFQLAQFADLIKQGNLACIPLLFIEEPESHMHPQMQQTFVSYLETFLQKISEIHIQVFLTSHSSHIANTIDFSKIRYAQKTKRGVIYKDLNDFSKEDPDNIDLIKKYLTISRCDLFFADKAIYIEGASERLLLPDMIKKCEKAGLFDTQDYKLSAQYYTLIEVGGAYAYKFIPLSNFLGIPSLILTDIDSIKDDRTKSIVKDGQTTSNSTIKHWMRNVKKLTEKDKVRLPDIISLPDTEKTLKKTHIEFQIEENGLCGRSLEESIKNVNRATFEITDTSTESDLEFSGTSKTEFALNLIFNTPDYSIPQYIKNGLVWLNDQKVFV